MLRGVLVLAIACVGLQVGQATSLAAPSSAVLSAPTSNQVQVRIVQRHGAPVREDSTPNSTIILTTVCNETFLVIGSNGPWRQIYSVIGLPDEDTVDEDNDIFGWVHTDHIAIGPDPAAVDCAAAPSHRIGRQVESSSDRGCLTLRSEASPNAGESECRPDGSPYEIVSGPAGVGGAEWFEVRPLGGGANGWAPGQALYAIP
ncbi:MAG: hypothetical protein ACKVVP_14920 [Chloroflexota bacterium]